MKGKAHWDTLFSLFTKLISARPIAADKRTEQQKPLPGRPAAYRLIIWRLI